MRFVFSPPAGEVSGLLTLPWAEPLEDWRDERLVEIRQRGLSRHIVRFVAESGELYALKAINENLARREYRLLRWLGGLGIPAVTVVGVVVGRGRDADAILVTRFLEYSGTYRALFSSRRGGLPTDRLLDALVELLARLHLAGFFWGDCSLSNALFRADAGTYQACLVDAETSEQHAALTDGQRSFDLDIAAERVCGELLDLQAGELLPDDIDPVEVSEDLVRRYQGLWAELNSEELIRPEDQRHRIGKRLRRLNDLGFCADEVELVSGADGVRLRVRTKVAESGQSSTELFRLTGIRAEEHQAQRLLNDIASFRAYLEQKGGYPCSETVTAHRWLEDIYDPVVVAIPERLRGRLAPPEIFHEILEHRWYMSEAAGRDVGTTAAAQSYFDTVLPDVPKPLTTAADGATTGSIPMIG